MAAKKNQEDQPVTPAPETEETRSQLDEANEEIDRLIEENEQLRNQLASRKSRAAATVRGIPIVLRRDAKVGELQAKSGNALAVVHLAEGVSLNYLVDAVRNNIAGEDLTRDADDE